MGSLENALDKIPTPCALPKLNLLHPEYLWYLVRYNLPPAGVAAITNLNLPPVPTSVSASVRSFHCAPPERPWNEQQLSPGSVASTSFRFAQRPRIAPPRCGIGLLPGNNVRYGGQSCLNPDGSAEWQWDNSREKFVDAKRGRFEEVDDEFRRPATWGFRLPRSERSVDQIQHRFQQGSRFPPPRSSLNPINPAFPVPASYAEYPHVDLQSSQNSKAHFDANFSCGQFEQRRAQLSPDGPLLPMQQHANTQPPQSTAATTALPKRWGFSTSRSDAEISAAQAAAEQSDSSCRTGSSMMADVDANAPVTFGEVLKDFPDIVTRMKDPNSATLLYPFCDLLVTNLPPGVTSKFLADLCSAHGEVGNIALGSPELSVRIGRNAAVIGFKAYDAMLLAYREFDKLMLECNNVSRCLSACPTPSCYFRCAAMGVDISERADCLSSNNSSRKSSEGTVEVNMAPNLSEIALPPPLEQSVVSKLPAHSNSGLHAVLSPPQVCSSINFPVPAAQRIGFAGAETCPPLCNAACSTSGPFLSDQQARENRGAQSGNGTREEERLRVIVKEERDDCASQGERKRKASFENREVCAAFVKNEQTDQSGSDLDSAKRISRDLSCADSCTMPQTGVLRSSCSTAIADPAAGIVGSRLSGGLDIDSSSIPAAVKDEISAAAEALNAVSKWDRSSFTPLPVLTEIQVDATAMESSSSGAEVTGQQKDNSDVETSIRVIDEVNCSIDSLPDAHQSLVAKVLHAAEKGKRSANSEKKIKSTVRRSRKHSDSASGSSSSASHSSADSSSDSGSSVSDSESSEDSDKDSPHKLYRKKRRTVEAVVRKHRNGSQSSHTRTKKRKSRSRSRSRHRRDVRKSSKRSKTHRHRSRKRTRSRSRRREDSGRHGHHHHHTSKRDEHHHSFNNFRNFSGRGGYRPPRFGHFSRNGHPFQKNGFAQRGLGRNTFRGMSRVSRHYSRSRSRSQDATGRRSRSHSREKHRIDDQAEVAIRDVVRSNGPYLSGTSVSCNRGKLNGFRDSEENAYDCVDDAYSPSESITGENMSSISDDDCDNFDTTNLESSPRAKCFAGKQRMTAHNTTKEEGEIE